MSASQDENSTSLSKVLRVRQAASTLGISERTVYRRLRSGKLEELPAEMPAADSVMTIVNEVMMAELISAQIEPRLNKIACQNDMTNDKLSVLRQELANRDAQIQSLLENQKELTLIIQKLQAQIFELARLALLQPTKGDEKQTEGAAPLEPTSVVHRQGLRDWLRNLWRHGGSR